MDKLIAAYTTEPPQGANWLLRVAKQEYSHGWYIAAYIDSERGIKRIEAERDLSVRSFENYSEIIEEKINSVSEGTSPWAKLYKDHAKLGLYNAEYNQDFSSLNDALASANEAQIYADLSKRISVLPVTEQKKTPLIDAKKFAVFGAMILGLVLIIFYYTLTRDPHDFGPKKRHLG